MEKMFVTTWFYASKENETREVGVFKTKQKKFYGERAVDIAEFSQQLENIYNDFYSKGNDVGNIVPIAMGTSEHCKQSNGNYVGDVGFSITRGAVIVGKKRCVNKAMNRPLLQKVINKLLSFLMFQCLI